MTCTYANRPRTRADERQTAKIIELPAAKVANEAYHRGIEMGSKLVAQATNRVRWTVTVKACDAGAIGLAVGLLLGVIADHLVRK